MRQARPHQCGMTLVELLVSMAIGLAVLLAAGSLLMSANAAWVAQAGSAAASEGGHHALELIARAVRQAGYNPGAGTDDAPAAMTGLDAQTLGKTSDGIAEPLDAAVNGSDVLAVRFAGSGPEPGGDGSALSCAGFAVNGHEDGWSIFYVARNEQGVAELRCKYQGNGGWSADAVVAGVDSFQLLYGVDTDTPADGTANRYASATEVDALDAALVLSGATEADRERDRNRRTHWKRIASVQVALLLQGARVRTNEPLTYDLFGPGYGEAFGTADRGTRLAEAGLAVDGGARERRLFAATVALRNGAP